MSYVKQTEQANRHLLPDLVRAFALVGIAVVNVTVIAYPLMGGYVYGGLNTWLDKVMYFVVNSLFLMKSYPLFAFMFGVGFAYQLKSAERVGAKFRGRYFRRIVGLFLLGLLNIMFFFQGDILVLYSILGSFLFLFKDAVAKTLVRWGIGLFILQVVVFSGMTLVVYLGHKYSPADMTLELVKINESVARSEQVFGRGTFIEALLLRIQEWSEIIVLGLFMEGLGAMAFFLFGLAAVRSNLVANPDAAVWKTCRTVFLPIGLIGSTFAAYLVATGDGVISFSSMLAMTCIAFFAFFSALGYLGLIAGWAAKPMTRFKSFLARGGATTLTAYLLQGLFLSLIFNNYGFGLFGQLGAAACIAIALLVSVLTILFSSFWYRSFRHGPVEYGLRKFTYLSS